MSKGCNIEHDEDDEVYVLTFPYNEELQEELKTDYEAYWDGDQKAWIVDDTDVSEHELQELISQYYPGAF